MKLLSKIFLFCSIVLSYKGYSQKKNELAIISHVEKTAAHFEEVSPGITKETHKDVNFVFGLTYERAFNNKSSGVIGVKYRKALNDIYIPVPAGANLTDYAHFFIQENFITIPLQYKHNFPLLSISAGGSLDYFVSWKEAKRYYYAPLQTYDKFFDKKLSVGILGTISKKIPLDQHLLLEPSLYYNRILSFQRTYFGGGVELKYKF